MSFRAYAGAIMFLFAVFSNSPASAIPLIFTDRASFDAAVGSTTLLTFDTFEPLTPDPDSLTHADFEATYAGMFHIGGDINGAILVYQVPGAIQLGNGTGFGAGTSIPVLAFGADFTPLSTLNCALGCTSLGAIFSFTGTESDPFAASFRVGEPQFLGFLFTGPTVVGIGMLEGIGDNRMLIDNVAMKTPEASPLLLLGLGIAVLVGYHLRKSKDASCSHRC
jgi:hypothetical protein